MPAAPPSLVAVAERVGDRLTQLLDVERARWSALDPDLAWPLDALRDLLISGGKRLRPAFCHWGFVGAGGDPDDDVSVRVGAAFELLHAFALFHDDVMDGSATRRGIRTTHLVFADTHEQDGWSGEARRFGEGVAILVGDLAFVYADQLLRDVPREVWEVWNELRIELNIGQYLDILGTARRERTPSTTERIARFKSGKYTVERPLHVGALLAAPGRAAELLPALSAYGLPLGDAFQMRDDVLGAFGDHTLTGKPVGDDLREGKPTPLLALATQSATEAQATVLSRVGRADLSEEDVRAIQQVLVDTGALTALETRIDALVHDALESLDHAPLNEDARKALTELAHYVAWRES
ncbi:MAG TPA: polyprenyl synthetase family protein [Acidimicrobiales bacterium]|nr:polyprenyl synthetase family protein [Acidimicrobiales bacterium]